ncbi:hypothetical protein H310_09684 [Aphanomyces invadans]|uniref:Peptidase A2 domain-containing protein n=1 Tax=Aphanomyces invadans TaxID=157072 RepID=A0A024TVI2_9STRA|nr:hypothetical protein H310_09684 [Aphanomyces invadans]ETV97347.1 hypothetical protein H310_09684 [Aphanomyces invadans]|eukprot:XP_008874055.1 hypothetical protein H310_09684 [Aphanomyces invadans]
MAAIKPPAVQKRVRELMKLHENNTCGVTASSNLWFKLPLCPPKLLAEKVKEQEKKLKGNRDHPKKGDKPVAVVNVDNVPVSNFTHNDGKCLSADHNEFKCPKAAIGEGRLLMDRAKSIWAETKKKGKPEKAVTIAREVKTVDPNEKMAVLCAANVVSTANHVVALDASFDSGADQSVIPQRHS